MIYCTWHTLEYHVFPPNAITVHFLDFNILTLITSPSPDAKLFAEVGNQKNYIVKLCLFLINLFFSFHFFLPDHWGDSSMPEAVIWKMDQKDSSLTPGTYLWESGLILPLLIIALLCNTVWRQYSYHSSGSHSFPISKHMWCLGATLHCQRELKQEQAGYLLDCSKSAETTKQWWILRSIFLNMNLNFIMTKTWGKWNQYLLSCPIKAAVPIRVWDFYVPARDWNKRKTVKLILMIY